MNDKKTTYSKLIIDIADYLFEHPDKKTSDVLSVFVGKCRKSGRTIERYIEKARVYNLQRIQKQESAREDVLLESARESVKRAILNREEALEILTSISKGESRKIPVESEGVGGVEACTKWSHEAPSDGDRVKAIDKLSQLQGWYAPKRAEVTGRDGKGLFEKSVSELESELIEIVSKINE
jgi:hypothetical protein